jgi:hypothetical protein
VKKVHGSTLDLFDGGEPGCDADADGASPAGRT